LTSEGFWTSYPLSLDYTGVPLAPLLVCNVILDAMDATEVYEDALSVVLRGETNAKAAISAAEGWELADA
jgi:hypothetical protein